MNISMFHGHHTAIRYSYPITHNLIILFEAETCFNRTIKI